MNTPQKKSIFASRLLVVLILAGGVTGVIALGYMTSDAYSLVAAIGLPLLLITAYCYLHFPHRLLMAFGVFILCQKLLKLNAARIDPLYGTMVGYADEVMVLWLFILFLCRQALSRGTFSRTGFGIPLLGFVLTGILSSLIGHVPLWIVVIQLFLYLKGFLFFYTIFHLPINRTCLQSYIRFFAGVGIVVLALGIVDLINPYWFRAVTGNEINVGLRFGLPSTKSIFTHPGDFGWFMAFLTLYAFAYYMIFNRNIYLAFGLIFSLGSFLSMRRRNLAGIFTGLIFGIWKQPKVEKVRAGIILGAIIALFIVLAWSTIEMLYTDLMEGYVTTRRPREEARNVLYIGSFQIARDYFPLGAGLGRYGSWMSAAVYSPLYREYRMNEVYGLTPDKPQFATDTFWPAILGETGVLGLIFYLWICLRIFLFLNYQATAEHAPYVKAFLLGTFLVFIESLIESPASAVYTGGPTVYFIFGILGLGYAASLEKKYHVSQSFCVDKR